MKKRPEQILLRAEKNPWYHLNSGRARTLSGTDMPASWLTGDDSVGTYWGNPVRLRRSGTASFWPARRLAATASSLNARTGITSSRHCVCDINADFSTGFRICQRRSENSSGSSSTRVGSSDTVGNSGSGDSGSMSSGSSRSGSGSGSFGVSASRPGRMR